jgi:ribosome-associated translation inhibitor RaiA
MTLLFLTRAFDKEVRALKHMSEQFEDVSIQYHGFHPSEFFRSFVLSKLRDLREEAPDRSALKAAFSRDGRLLRGMVRIQSVAGSFFAEAEGSRLTEVIRKLISRLRRQLGKWKASRFHEARKWKSFAERRESHEDVVA